MASAMVFGEHQDERAFALLGHLLTDHLEPYSPPVDDHKITQLECEARERARTLYNSPAAWKRFVYPGLIQRWREMEASHLEYAWYMRHRQTILDILQSWNDPRAIPALRLALQRCWHIEPHTHGFSDTLHQLQDTLAYTLGQLSAWDALEGLETPGLPPSRFKLARMFLVFGLLHVNLGVLHMSLLHIYHGDLTPSSSRQPLTLTRWRRCCENALAWMNIWPEPISTSSSNGTWNVTNSGSGRRRLSAVRLK